jgi:acid phosphatase type 7
MPLRGTLLRLNGDTRSGDSGLSSSVSDSNDVAAIGALRMAYGWKQLRAALFGCLLFASQTAQRQSAISYAALQADSKPAPSAQPKLSDKSDTFILVGAGDIASCLSPAGAVATAELIDQIPGTVFAAGDLAYERGTYEQFQTCYQLTWGRFKQRTRPAPGNHEYNGSDASGYFRYWGKQAGDPEKGYYSYDLGAWHIVVLNTNCSVKELGGCGKGSPEERWLRQDLAAHPGACILAYGHHALFSSGIFPRHARHPELRAFWEDLYAAHADLVLAGHEHSYERFAPQDPEGHVNPQHGIREIVVGTGGRSHTFLGPPQENSEVRNDSTYGVLKLTLSPKEYRWEFIPEAGKTFRDSGQGSCQNAHASAE